MILNKISAYKPWNSVSTSLLVYIVALVACIIFFEALGTIYLAYLVSILLILQCIGLKIQRRNYMTVASPALSRVGRIVLIHGHQNPMGQMIQHTFKIRGKLYCAGCYGLASGTLISLVFVTFYITDNIEWRILAFMAAAVPICFLPTLLRCITQKEISAFVRFISYGLLPAGSWILILIVHDFFQSWLLNVFILGLVVLGWNTGGYYLLMHKKK